MLHSNKSVREHCAHGRRQRSYELDAEHEYPERLRQWLRVSAASAAPALSALLHRCSTMSTIFIYNTITSPIYCPFDHQLRRIQTFRKRVNSLL